jgi:hypothetical protein
VLYADLDGTITGPGGSLFAAADGGTTLSAAQALCRLREARIQLVLMSGRTRRGIDEVARILGASAYLAELGGVLVELEGSGDGSVDEVVRNPAAPVGSAEEIVRSGAGALLLERFPRRLLPVAPWSEIGMMLQGHVEVAEANAALEEAGHAWLELLDNGRLRRRHDVLDIAETRAYHLVPRGVSKASGVRLHMQRHGIVAEQAAAVGDSGADLGVAADVGAFFLVANGLEAFAGAPPVHAIVTASARGEGFAEAVEALLASGR